MSSTEPAKGNAERHAAPYVRQRPTHRSVEPIDDLASETGEPESDDQGSSRAAGGVLPTLGHRRSRAEGVQLRRDLHYGQYLEIPRGRRDIFASRERKTRIKTAIALVAVLAVLAIVVFFVWEYMQTNWGSTAR
ncbi:hypothetical protein INF26_06490 [Olsenella sp. DSM 107455]|uniref:Uncharacterized protein n=1 Tax=Thermophilibacter gallinarum TaxID=2779357 RepID=A0ABR9QTU5_9ACTN|nr:hypothetical protein [Thermophilibacter gallinarum]MBE5024496.1 hypothetical protein [Thermophilibacter gallinarum]